MKKIKIVHISYSYGLGNGIAHVDACFHNSLIKQKFHFISYVLRYDFPSHQKIIIDNCIHISILDAFKILYNEFLDTDIVQINGGLDPVACHAAAYAGVPSIIEILHQVETGGLHPYIDVIVCVSDVVKKVQCFDKTVVINNGIDCSKFTFQQGRRSADKIIGVQVANSAKDLYIELGEVVQELYMPNFTAFSVGDRETKGVITPLGMISDMPKIYHSADLLFLLEKKSAFGLVFAEAMACGTLPIIASTSGATTFVEHEKNGWIVNFQSKADACKLLEHAASTVQSNRFLEMQKAARDKIERNYSLQAMLVRYQGLWQALAGRPRRFPAKPAVWMNFVLSNLLFKNNNPSTLSIVTRFLNDPRPLEGYFLQHPLGQATLCFCLQQFCPFLLSQGLQEIVSGLCTKLHQSRCVSTMLTAIESQLSHCPHEPAR